jgi:phosphatidylserine/phosphatidylglycerophosphate/cardiolipin synthase-like enzyme
MLYWNEKAESKTLLLTIYYKGEKMLKAIVILPLLFVSTCSVADNFSTNASYKVCFTPKEQCANLIVTTINQAQKQVLVQAYSFTSAPIARALVNAHKRGVDVRVILDKSQFRERGFSSARFFSDYGIPILIDYQPSIAHNKVIIIDQKIVITGSFNFTRAAEKRNAENVIVISDSVLAKKYGINWDQRAKVSESIGTSTK